MVNKLIGFDFEFSSRTGRLQNIGLESSLKNLGWVILKPKIYQSKFTYWFSVIFDSICSRANYLYWMPSYKPLLLLFPVIFFFRIRFFFGIRDLWYGNPQPIKSIKGRVFNRAGYFVFYLYGKLCNVKWIAISNEMKEDIMKFHPFIKNKNIIVSSTGDVLRNIQNSPKIEYELGYFGTFDLQMDLNKYLDLKSKFSFIHYGLNDYDIEVSGYIKSDKELNNEMSKCKLLLIFGVNDYSRLNRKIFHLLQTNKALIYFGPRNNVTYRILSDYEGVFFNPSDSEIRTLLDNEYNYQRDIGKFLYHNIAKKLHEDICNS